VCWKADDPPPRKLPLWPCRYHLKCMAGCGSLARIIVRYVEDGGAPSGQAEFCNSDAKIEIKKAKDNKIAIP
jgi:hypothetical protein